MTDSQPIIITITEEVENPKQSRPSIKFLNTMSEKLYGQNAKGKVTYHPYTSTGGGNYIASTVFVYDANGKIKQCRNGSYTKADLDRFLEDLAKFG